LKSRVKRAETVKERGGEREGKRLSRKHPRQWGRDKI